MHREDTSAARPEPHLSGDVTRAILLRDKYHCTATVQPREVRPGVWFPKQARRCSIVGSEMVVVDGKTLCPRHAREARDA